MLNAEQRDRLRRSAITPRNRLSLALELAGVTQTELADATGYGQPYISRIATGRYSDLPIETTRTLSRFFGCYIEDLFPGPEDRARPERRQASEDRRRGGRRRSNRFSQPDRRKDARR